jgi:hypothetical protein
MQEQEVITVDASQLFTNLAALLAAKNSTKAPEKEGDFDLKLITATLIYKPKDVATLEEGLAKAIEKGHMNARIHENQIVYDNPNIIKMGAELRKKIDLENNGFVVWATEGAIVLLRVPRANEATAKMLDFYSDKNYRTTNKKVADAIRTLFGEVSDLTIVELTEDDKLVYFDETTKPYSSLGWKIVVK